jgi:hypothetical protein
MKNVTAAVLFYGDHPELAARVLGSLRDRMEEGASYIRDIRLGMNE